MKTSVDNYFAAARTFVDVYPYEVPKIVAYIHECYLDQVANREKLEQHWLLEIISPMEWFYIASVVNQIIESWEHDPTPWEFAKTLFWGHRAIFSADCILRYAQTTDCPAEVKKHIEYLFN